MSRQLRIFPFSVAAACITSTKVPGIWARLGWILSVCVRSGMTEESNDHVILIQLDLVFQNIPWRVHISLRSPMCSANVDSLNANSLWSGGSQFLMRMWFWWRRCCFLNSGYRCEEFHSLAWTSCMGNLQVGACWTARPSESAVFLIIFKRFMMSWKWRVSLQQLVELWGWQRSREKIHICLVFHFECIFEKMVMENQFFTMQKLNRLSVEEKKWGAQQLPYGPWKEKTFHPNCPVWVAVFALEDVLPYPQPLPHWIRKRSGHLSCYWLVVVVCPFAVLI